MPLARLNLFADLALAAAWSPLAGVFLAAIMGLNAFTGPTTAMTPRTTDLITICIVVLCLLCPMGVVALYFIHQRREHAVVRLFAAPTDPLADLPTRLGAWSVKHLTPDDVVMVRRPVPRAVAFLGNSAMTAGAVPIAMSLGQGFGGPYTWATILVLYIPVAIVLNIRIRLHLSRLPNSIRFSETRSIVVQLPLASRTGTLLHPLAPSITTDQGFLVQDSIEWLLFTGLSVGNYGEWQRRCLAAWLGAEKSLRADSVTLAPISSPPPPP